MTTTTSPTIAALAAALAKAQGAMRHAVKDSVNPHFKTTYADLASVIDALREPLASNGLAYTQHPETTERGAGATTILMHSSGEWVSSTLILPLSKADAQGCGSAITYARRYALAALCGVGQDDDDGNAAAAKPKPAQAPTTEYPRRSQPAGAAPVKGPTAEQSREVKACLLSLDVQTARSAYVNATIGKPPDTVADYDRVIDVLRKRVTAKMADGDEDARTAAEHAASGGDRD